MCDVIRPTETAVGRSFYCILYFGFNVKSNRTEDSQVLLVLFSYRDLKKKNRQKEFSMGLVDPISYLVIKLMF